MQSFCDFKSIRQNTQVYYPSKRKVIENKLKIELNIEIVFH